MIVTRRWSREKSRPTSILPRQRNTPFQAKMWQGKLEIDLRKAGIESEIYSVTSQIASLRASYDTAKGSLQFQYDSYSAQARQTYINYMMLERDLLFINSIDGKRMQSISPLSLSIWICNNVFRIAPPAEHLNQALFF